MEGSYYSYETMQTSMINSQNKNNKEKYLGLSRRLEEKIIEIKKSRTELDDISINIKNATIPEIYKGRVINAYKGRIVEVKDKVDNEIKVLNEIILALENSLRKAEDLASEYSIAWEDEKERLRESGVI